MVRKMFVNLTVKDSKIAMDFFGKLGFQFNAQFTDDAAACMIVSEDIYVMLLMEDKFKALTPQQTMDATRFTEAQLCLSAASQDEVNEPALQSGRCRRKDPQGTARKQFHVRSRFPGFGWTYMGVGLHGIESQLSKRR